MEDINLHFTGDFHAITSAHNLLAAAVDNHLHHGNALGMDVRQVLWRRVLDVNDRALRNVVVGLGGRLDGVPREAGFLITSASEIMAALCLAENPGDLKARLGRMVVALSPDGGAVLADELKVTGAMAALLRDAVHPNLVQTMEGTPALVHGGPFANIAHGCNSVIATRMALKLGDICLTEAGFATDLGAEKFFDIKCRAAGLKPDAALIVATARALKYHGGVPLPDVGKENVEALRRGLDNLEAHVASVRQFKVPVLVGLNRYPTDTEREYQAVFDRCATLGVPAYVADVFGRGGEGGEDLARGLLKLLETERSAFEPLYPPDAPVKEARDDRHARLRRRRRRLFEKGRPPDRPGGGARLRPDARVRGQDAAVAVRRPDPAQPAAGFPHHHQRRADLGRRGVPRGAGRRHHDHAGAAAQAQCGRRGHHAGGTITGSSSR
jgi:formate--tetrahydrofolate ligase